MRNLLYVGDRDDQNWNFIKIFARFLLNMSSPLWEFFYCASCKIWAIIIHTAKVRRNNIARGLALYEPPTTLPTATTTRSMNRRQHRLTVRRCGKKPALKFYLAVLRNVRYGWWRMMRRPIWRLSLTSTKTEEWTVELSKSTMMSYMGSRL